LGAERAPNVDRPYRRTHSPIASQSY
jgi:hypothetical protein